MLKQLTEVFSLYKEDFPTKQEAFDYFKKDFRYNEHRDFGITEILNEDEILCWFIFQIEQTY